MTQTSMETATARFEKLWNDAQTQDQVRLKVDTKVAEASNPLSYLENYLPQHYAARFSDLADQCFAEQLLSSEQHEQLKLALSVQQDLFSEMNQEKLKRVILSIDI